MIFLIAVNWISRCNRTFYNSVKVQNLTLGFNQYQEIQKINVIQIPYICTILNWTIQFEIICIIYYISYIL